MDAWTGRVREVAGAMSMLSVARSPRFRVYELDLGFGRPAKVDIVSVLRTCALAVAESLRSAGGMEVGVKRPSAAGWHGAVPQVLRRCHRGGARAELS
jgi:hypothetical protein